MGDPRGKSCQDPHPYSLLHHGHPTPPIDIEPPPSSVPQPHRPVTARALPLPLSSKPECHPRAHPSGLRRRRQASYCCLALDIHWTPPSIPNAQLPLAPSVDPSPSCAPPRPCTLWMPRATCAFQSMRSRSCSASHARVHGTVRASPRYPRPTRPSPYVLWPRPKLCAPALKPTPF
jgi:hypothetical protein